MSRVCEHQYLSRGKIQQRVKHNPANPCPNPPEWVQELEEKDARIAELEADKAEIREVLMRERRDFGKLVTELKTLLIDLADAHQFKDDWNERIDALARR